MNAEWPKQELDRIRQHVVSAGCESLTHDKFQDDLYRFIMDGKGNGHGVIELGCYRGGLSAILATACKKLNWPFYGIDVNAECLETARRLLGDLGLLDSARFFKGTFQRFVEEVRLEAKPLLVLIDGDHQYENVLADIKSLYRLQPLSYAAAFHDFSLRHEDLDVRVDKAIFDFFGADAPLTYLGEHFTEDCPHPITTRHEPKSHYWELNGREGAVITLPPRPQSLFSAGHSGVRKLLARLFHTPG